METPIYLRSFARLAEAGQSSRYDSIVPGSERCQARCCNMVTPRAGYGLFVQHLEGKMATPALLLQQRKPEAQQRVHHAYLIDISYPNGAQAHIGNQLLDHLSPFAIRPAVEEIGLLRSE